MPETESAWLIEFHPFYGYVHKSSFSTTKDPNQAKRFQSEKQAKIYASKGPGGKAVFVYGLEPDR